MDSWFTFQDGVVRLALYVQPGAKKTEVAGEHDLRLKIRLAAPPVEGQANEALVVWLAKTLQVPKRQVLLVRGEKSRYKVVNIQGISAPDTVLQRLQGISS